MGGRGLPRSPLFIQVIQEANTVTIQAALDMIDTLKPNMFSTQQKVAWLSDLDGMVYREIILNHEGFEDMEPFTGYDVETPNDTVLLATEPYSDVYRHYLSAQMDIANRETGEYAKDMALYNSAWQTLVDWYNRNHLPIAKAKRLRF